MKKSFENVMVKQSDKELMKIVSIDKNHYNTNTILSAENELLKRGVSKEEIAAAKIKLHQIKKYEEYILSKKVSKFKRLVNLIVDSLFASILSMIFLFTLSSIYYLLGYKIIQTNDVYSEITMNEIITCILNLLVFVIGYLSYFIVLEYKFKKTIAPLLIWSLIFSKDSPSKPTTPTIAMSIMKLAMNKNSI